jgi:imidazolonepropionase-like amidohydrolase
MTGAPPRRSNNHLEEGVAAIGTSHAVAISRGASPDAHGKFLIPGLVDMHVHLTAAGEPDGSRKFSASSCSPMASPAFGTWAVI